MRKYSALLFLILLSWTAQAAPGGYAFRHYTSREGLASNSVRAVLQDHMGLIWLGTSIGLDSFDGRDIIHHPFPEGENGSVLCLFEDSAHTLWVGTDNTLYKYADDEIARVDGFQETEITGIVEEDDGTMWVGTWGKGLFRIRNDVPERLLDGHLVEDILIARDGRIWVADASVGEGILVYNAASGDFVSPGLSFDGCTPTRVCAMDEDGNGDLWLGTWNLGLYRIDLASKTVLPAAAPGPGFNHIHSLTYDSTGNFLVGSDDGLLEMNLLTGERTLYRNDRNDPSSLSDKFVYPVARDHEGGLWIGTYYGGVNYAAPDAGRFTTRSLTELVSADEKYIVSCFCEDPDGTLWLGSDNGGLFRYDPARNTAERWQASRGSARRFTTLNIHALLRLENNLWIGTYSDNLIRLDIRTGRIREYDGEDGLDAPSVYALCIDKDGRLWAGTNSGICRYDPAADRFILERAVGDWVMDIKADADGSLWCSTVRNGVLCRKADGTWKNYRREDGLPSDYINCLQPTPGGVYVGTQQGLAVFGKEGVTALPVHGDIQKVVFDGKQVWLSTSSDIVR